MTEVRRRTAPFEVELELFSEDSMDAEMAEVSVSSGSRPSEPKKKPNDAASIALLLLLYTLQGVPMGLSGSMPLVLQGRVSYKEQALFSMVSLPFSLKLFWAPIVDSVYWPRHGRRKSWLVPVQFACGALMLRTSHSLVRRNRHPTSGRFQPRQHLLQVQSTASSASCSEVTPAHVQHSQ